jgi:hypothetical protein
MPLSIPRGYSDRNASTGSIRAAFEAGYTPKNNPTLVATSKPITTDQSWTELGREVVSVTNFASRIPRSTPHTPPIAAIVADSIRNCN